MSIDYDRLRKHLDKSSPGPWYATQDDWGDIIIGNEEGHSMGWGDQVRFKFEAGDKTHDPALVALAPDMARELLRLRDGIKTLADEKRALAERLCDPRVEMLNPDWLAEVGGEEPIGLSLHRVCDDLTDLLEGDTK